jgi:hypothetical protein
MDTPELLCELSVFNISFSPELAVAADTANLGSILRNRFGRNLRMKPSLVKFKF